MATITVGTAIAWKQEKFSAVYTDGTSVWAAGLNGSIHKFTLSTGAYVGKVAQLEGEITAMAVYSTFLYVGTDKGRIYVFTLSTMAPVALTAPYFSDQITGLSVTGTTLVVAMNSGKIRQYSIS